MNKQSNAEIDFAKKYYLGFFLALSAGLIWSFGAPTIRYMVDAQIYQWHYLFCRGITVATILIFFYYIKKECSFIIILEELGHQEL